MDGGWEAGRLGDWAAERPRQTCMTGSIIVISMAFTCLAHKRNAKAKICVQIYLSMRIDSKTKSSWVERLPVRNSNLATVPHFVVVHVMCLYVCTCLYIVIQCRACVCVCYRILSMYMGLWSLTLKSGCCLLVRFVASQSIVQMSKLHLLCASQKLKQIILPIAFWFRMSVTVLILDVVSWAAGGGRAYSQPSTIYVNFCVFAASGAWNYAMPLLIYDQPNGNQMKTLVMGTWLIHRYCVK